MDAAKKGEICACRRDKVNKSDENTFNVRLIFSKVALLFFKRGYLRCLVSVLLAGSC